MKRKVLSVILTGAMVAGLAGTVTVHAEEQKTYNIGICQLVQHEALDAATQGFEDAVKEGLGEENVTFDEQNAQGDSATCSTIINNFVSSNVDLILANATASLQAAAAGTSDIPILGTAVTEYGVALDLTDFDGTVGGNISGTSDLAPLDQQAAMLNELFPDAKTVGLLYCSAEPNSQYQVDTVKAALEDLGYTCEYYAFSDSNDISSVVTNAVADSDVIYVPTDNTAASNTELINNICLPAKVPVIAGEEGICSGCGVATLSISYYDLGKATGEMAVKILKDGEDISTVVTNAVADSDVIYVPTDNTAASNTELINNICLPAKVPVIAGEEGICSGCGVATLSISYYDLGKATGEMAVKILKDGEDISTMPIEYAPNFTKEYNADICAELGIEVPDDYVAIGADAE